MTESKGPCPSRDTSVSQAVDGGLQMQAPTSRATVALRPPCRRVPASRRAGRPRSHLQMALKCTCSACVCHAMTAKRGDSPVPCRLDTRKCQATGCRAGAEGGAWGMGAEQHPAWSRDSRASEEPRKQMQKQCRHGCQGMVQMLRMSTLTVPGPAGLAQFHQRGKDRSEMPGP